MPSPPQPASTNTPALSNPQQPGDLLMYRLHKLSAAAGRLVTRMLERRYGITRREWGMLMWLARAPGLSPSELAAHLELDRARISRAIASMQAKGLLHKQTSSGNRRTAALQLTAAGLALHDELLPQVRAINLQLAAALDPQQQSQLERSLELLQAQASALEGGDTADTHAIYPPRQSGKREAATTKI